MSKQEQEDLKKLLLESTKENTLLLLEIKYYKTENNSINKKLKELNENTIVESMNDMKIQYQQLVETTVPIDLYTSIKYDVKQFKKIINTVDLLTDINIDCINNLIEFCKNENENNNYKDKIIIDLLELGYSFSIFKNLYRNHYNDFECDCNLDNL